MAIEIIKSIKTGEKQNPYYLLVFNYMIGDANGNTTSEVKLSINNPYIERFCTLISSLKPTKGHWGVMLERQRMRQHVNEEQISKEDMEFLERVMFIEHFDDDELCAVFKSEEEIDFAAEFYDGVRAMSEYSFLVFEGVSLYYIDEYGNKFNTRFVD